MSDVICSEVIGWNLFPGGKSLVADINGDSRQEIIIRSPRNQWVGVLYDHGDILVADWIGYDWINPAGNSGANGWNLRTHDIFLVADIDGDGRHEIVVVSPNGMWIGVLYEHGGALVAGWIAQHLYRWFKARPDIESSIVWQGAGSSRRWSFWGRDRKAQLCQAFELARIGRSIAVADIPPNQASMADDEEVTTILSYSDAWAYFKASVANSLAVEIGAQLPWSIQSYSADQLAQLFDSRQFFWWSREHQGFCIESRHGHIVPSPPGRTRDFITTNDLIGSSRQNCLARVVEWCRENLIHYSGGRTAANMEDQWQYRGYPPMTRVLDGTVQTSRLENGIQHRTAGCWGTTGLLSALLRVINIPVMLVSVAGHAQPWFMADSQYLSHGDDPYNRLTKATPPFPASEILIDQMKYDSWFGSNVGDAEKSNNIGRRTRELAITYLPNYLLHAYCDDLADGSSHANGKVFDIFSRYYTVVQLEAEGLWGRMDAKIANFGGCGHVP